MIRKGLVKLLHFYFGIFCHFYIAIYRESKIDGEVKYLNVEEYLKGLEQDR